MFTPTETEKAELKRIADNESAMVILKKLLLGAVDVEELLYEKVGKLTDEQLGSHMRALHEGKRIIEEAFKELENSKTVEKTDDDTNTHI